MSSSLKWILPAACFLSTLPSPSQSTIYYVSQSITDISDEDRAGLSWSNAFSSIQDGLSAANENGDEIWISSGQYYPDTISRSQCFVINAKNSISIYGSFYGNESSIDDRIIGDETKTILDGDIGELNDISDNCYHIISLETLSSNSKKKNSGINLLIDGITFENGNADSDGDGFDIDQFGGVLYAGNINGYIELTFSKCHFNSNKAIEGGAIWASDTNIVINIEGSEFFHNMALKGLFKGGYGGAIFSTHKNIITINQTLFFNNTAIHRGGAIYGDYGSDITCDSCEFWSNKVTEGHGGAWFMEDRNSQSTGTFGTVINCEFDGNTASYFGGALCWFNGVSPTVIDSKFINNIAELGGAITNYDQIYYQQNWKNNYFDDNFANAAESANDIYNDSILNINQLSDIDSGYEIDIFEELSGLWDQRELTYQFNDDLDESGYKCYVNVEICNAPFDCPDDLDGTSWDTAFYRVQDCLDKIRDDDPWTINNPEVWVATGTYNPSSSPNWAREDSEEYYSFIMYPNVHMYGGFEGTEQSRSERNWLKNPTYLSCQIGNNYCSTILDAAVNCIVDGFIFTSSRYTSGSSFMSGGNGDGNDNSDNNKDNEINNRRLLQSQGETLSEQETQFAVSFDEVVAATSPGRGGGIHTNGTNIVIANSIFTDMMVTKGGGIYCIGYTSGNKAKWPTIWNTAFISNVATRGAAIAADAWCHYECYYCYFENNRVTEKGGAVYLDWISSPRHINNVFYANLAYESGGALAADGSSIPEITNTSLIENIGFWEGGGLYCGSHGSSADAGLVIDNINFENNDAPFGTDDIWLWHNCFITDSWNGTSYIIEITSTTPLPDIIIGGDKDKEDNKKTSKLGGLEIGVFIVLTGIICLVCCMLCAVILFCCNKRKRRKELFGSERTRMINGANTMSSSTDDKLDQNNLRRSDFVISDEVTPMKADLSPIGHVHPTIGRVPDDTDADDSNDTDIEVSDDQQDNINNNGRNNRDNLRVDHVDASGISSDDVNTPGGDSNNGGMSGSERAKFEL